MLKIQTLPLLVAAVSLIACGPSAPKAGKLTIAMAANMQFAMQSLVDAFTQETGIGCETVISSSGKLNAQIKEGAPFDVFVSADMKYPADLFAGGYTTAAPEIYAYGKLVLWSMTESMQPYITTLSEDRIRHIALANPKTAPYGVAALEVLDHYGLRDQLDAKLIYGESISQTNQFIISKAAAIGFTAKSVVLSPQMKGQGHWRDIDDGIYSPIAQGIVMLKKDGGQLPATQRFYDFLFSDSARQILLDFGYGIGEGR